MSSETMAEGGGVTRSAGLWHLPSTGTGWWSVALTVAIVPVAWTLVTHAIDWPILDTAFAPVLLTVLIVSAAVTSLVAWRRRKDHSAPVFVSAVLSVPLAVFAVLTLAMEVLFPH